MAEGRDVRRDHAAAQPAGIRALPPVAAVRGHLRRRRGQRRGQPGAVRPREPLRDAAADARDRRRGGHARCAPKGVRTDHIVRGGDRVGIYYAETGASQRASTVIYDRATPRSARWSPTRSTGPRSSTGAHWFHVTGITPALGDKRRGRARARSITAATAAGAAGQRRPQLPQEAVDRERRRRQSWAR